MTRCARFVLMTACILMLAVSMSLESLFSTSIASALSAPPSLSSLSATTLDRSGRLRLSGANFGSTQGTGQVEIAGIPAFVTTWTDTAITAYVPESAPLGSDSVQVVTDGGASNALSLTVTSRTPNGHARWRFQMDALYTQARPALGPDGTVYALDVSNHLYALTPDGGLKWLVNVDPGKQGQGVDVGPDGTVYVGDTQQINAFTPDGSLKWTFVQNPGAFTLLGPNMGPDGNIYAVATQGIGIFSLTPQGQLRWSIPETFSRPIVTQQQIVFGPNGSARQLYFHANDHIAGVDLGGTQRFTDVDNASSANGDPQPTVASDGTLYTNIFPNGGAGLNLAAFTPDGTQLRTFFSSAQNVLSAPEVGSDGVVYIAQNLGTLHAFNPNGSQHWVYNSSTIFNYLNVNAQNNLLLAGGQITYGQPCFFQGFSTGGQSLWQLQLPGENGGLICPNTRARFAADGKTAYAGTQIPGENSADEYSYVYALDTSLVSDKVGVTSAVYSASKHRLNVQATSSNNTATLSVYVTATGQFIGTLSNNGEGKYSGKFAWPTNPQNITVRSSLGGSATKVVKMKQ